MEENSPRWYCIHTRSRHEEVVFQRLEDKKIHSFLPRLEVWSRRKDRRKKIQKALFPGYLFVHGILDPLHRLEILKTAGVVRILGNEKGPSPVPDFQIDSIKTILKDRGNGEAPICRTRFSHPWLIDDTSITVTTIVMDLKKRKFHITRGNPFDHPFTVFSLKN